MDDTFTTVSVSNIRLLFRRVSGTLDGIVVESKDCRGAAVPAIAPRS